MHILHVLIDNLLKINIIKCHRINTNKLNIILSEDLDYDILHDID